MNITYILKYKASAVYRTRTEYTEDSPAVLFLINSNAPSLMRFSQSPALPASDAASNQI